MGRGSILAVHSSDPVLSLAGAIGLAASTGTALIVDLRGDVHAGTRTLADIALDGPSHGELSPGRPGVAFLGGGQIASDSLEIVQDLSRHWPAIVLREPADTWEGPIVPVRPLYPGLLAASSSTASVWQPLGAALRPPGPGPVLPRLRSSLVRRLLAGRLPARSRWIDAWSPVWDLPWA